MDVFIVLVAIALAVRGYQHGLLVGAITLAGFALGAIAGARLAPALLHGGSSSPYAGLAALFGGLLVGAVLAALAEWLGEVLRARLVRRPAAGVLDGIGGAALMAVLALAIAWVLGVVALNTPGLGGIRQAIQRSTILGALNDALPPSGPILNVLHRVDPRPQVAGPQAGVSAPDPAAAREPGVRSASASVVRVLGTACGLGVEGSGWVAATGVVVTNAHVVAGEDDTTVSVDGGPELSAVPVDYEPHDDLAILRVDGLTASALSLAPLPAPGTDGGIVGYPENGPLDIEPARVGRTTTVTSQDSYGNGPVRRVMTPIRGLVRPGNSGGPVVGTDGRVLATVFAATLGGGPDSGLAVPNDIVSSALADVGSSPVSTGPCTA